MQRGKRWRVAVIAHDNARLIVMKGEKIEFFLIFFVVS